MAAVKKAPVVKQAKKKREYKGRREKQDAKRQLAQALEQRDRCPATTRAGTKCKHRAGKGTNHPGYGFCAYHGGNAPSKQMSASKDEVRNMATPVVVTPGQALAGVLHLSAGQLTYVTLRVAELQQEDIVSDVGVNRWVRFQQKIMHDVAKFAKLAADAGIDERVVKLAEEQTLMMAKVFEAVADDIHLDKEQRKLLGPAIRKQMAGMITGDGNILEGSATEQGGE